MRWEIDCVSYRSALENVIRRPKHEIPGVASYYLVIIAADVDKKEVFAWFLPIKNPLAKLFSR